MRILFVENKHVTRTWEALAPLLIDAGDDIHWLVQNDRWTPRIGTVHAVPLPRRADLGTPEPGRFERLRNQDRGVNYFGGDDRHYAYYAAEISRVMDAVRPDVVIGESTLFHELLAIDAARDRAIPYVFPTSVRYPVDRIGFLAGDTQEIVFGSRDVLPSEEIDRLLEIYSRRGQVPLFYSHLGRTGPLARVTALLRALGKGVTAARSRLAGERFNTPGLVHKARIERRRNGLLQRWDRVAARKSGLSARTNILFPLQMLPESTLDTWGYEWRDQLGTLRRLVEGSDNQTVFLVKTNPLPRYEITAEFVDFVAEHPRVRPLPSGTRMDDVFWTVDLIATVTGTVAIEGFLTGKPFVTLSYSLATRFAPGKTLILPSELQGVIDSIRGGTWPTADEADRRRFLEHQIAASHSAVMADTYYYPAVVDPGNLERLAAAIAHLRLAVDEGRALDDVRAAEERALMVARGESDARHRPAADKA